MYTHTHNRTKEKRPVGGNVNYSFFNAKKQVVIYFKER